MTLSFLKKTDQKSVKQNTSICLNRLAELFDSYVEEVWKQKPRQTVVVVLWGNIAAHMLLLRLCSRQVDKRQAESKMRGNICILHFFIDRLIFHQMFCSILANTTESYCTVCTVCVYKVQTVEVQ